MPAAAADMSLSKEDFFSYMDSKILNRFDGLDANLGNLDKRVTKASDDIRANTAKIDAQASLVHENKSSIAAIRNELVNLKSSGPSFAAVAGRTPEATEHPPPEDPEYNRARRSLRMWPIDGVTREEMWRDVKDFLQVKLALLDITSQAIQSIERPEIPSGVAAKREVVVTFTHISTRDSVVGASARLAQYIDDNRKPTAGIRMEIPRRLRAAFASLYKYGQQLRSRHGEGTRKHVKFEDNNRTLYLNVKLPGDETWSRVSLEVARRGLRARQLLTDEQLERRLDIVGPPSLKPRSSSLSQHPMDTSGAPSGRSSVSTIQ